MIGGHVTSAQSYQLPYLPHGYWGYNGEKGFFEHFKLSSDEKMRASGQNLWLEVCVPQSHNNLDESSQICKHSDPYSSTAIRPIGASDLT